MMPMPDGVRLATDIYRPKNAARKVPTIWVRTPYNFNFWDVHNGVPADMTAALTAVKRGYAYVVQNERGHFFSEGNYDILGSKTDGYNTVDWLTKQPWSNGKVGTTGCSSTAEYQMGVAALGHPGYAAMNVQGFGAGVGRVGPYYEQGNWYRGGAVQMLFIAWLYGEQNQVRPMFPPNTSREDLIRASKSFDLAQHLPPVDWSKALWHLPTQDIIKNVDGPHGIFADAMPVETGGRMIQRAPNDPAWYRGGLYHDDMKLNVPGLWFMSWYDVSVGPNLALYNHVRKTASPEIANEQWAVIAPVAHCCLHPRDRRHHRRRAQHGRRAARLQRHRLRLLRSVPEGREGDAARYAAEGHLLTRWASNKWQTADTWPPRRRAADDVLSVERRQGQHAERRRRARRRGARRRQARRVHLRPDEPGAVVRRQRLLHRQRGRRPARSISGEMEARDDILVYTSEPFKEGTEVSGPITPTLYVSSDAKDTDFTVKVLDVYPDGRAYNLDESIQRMRYRDGYDKPLAWMESGKVYKVTLQPLTTSNYFAAGPPAAHRSVEQQLPALRSQPEHRRQQLRRSRRASSRTTPCITRSSIRRR